MVEGESRKVGDVVLPPGLWSAMSHATNLELTASIAHEVNNPIAVIQGNLDLMRELLGATADGVRAELKLVDAQIERMRLIVTRLLQFARPTEYGPHQKIDFKAEHPFDVVADSFIDLAKKLGV